MAWRCWLCDTMTGLVDVPIDIPTFSWSLSIGDSAPRSASDVIPLSSESERTPHHSG